MADINSALCLVVPERGNKDNSFRRVEIEPTTVAFTIRYLNIISKQPRRPRIKYSLVKTKLKYNQKIITSKIILSDNILYLYMYICCSGQWDQSQLNP